MMNHYQRKILAEAVKHGGTNTSKIEQMANSVNEEALSEARRMGKRQLRKAVDDVFNKHFNGVPVPLMKLVAIYKEIEAAITSGADPDKAMGEIKKKHGIAEGVEVTEANDKIKLVKEMGSKTLYQYGFNYYIVSYSSMGGETAIFMADSSGKPKSYESLWSERRSVDHDSAIKDFVKYKFKKDAVVESTEIAEEPVLTGGEAAPTLFGWSKHQFEAKFRELLTRMGFERGIIHIKTEGQEMKMYFANAAKARDFVVAFNGLARRKSMGSVASVATQFNKIKSPTGTNAIVSLDLTMVRGESLDLDGTDLYEWFSEETETITEGYERVILNYLEDAGFKKGDAWFENGILYVAQKNLIARAKTTLKNKRDIYKLPEIKLDPDMKEETVSEGGVKAALADFMEGLPKEMVADIRKIIKLSVVNTTEAMKRKNKIEAIRKKYKIAPDFMGTPTWKIIIDYFNTFHGESVEVAEAFRFRQQDWERMRSKYKQGTPVNIVLKNGKTVSGTLLRMDKYDQGFATKGHLLHVKTSSGRVEVDDVDVKSIQWNNDSKTKMSEETEIEEGVRMMAGAEKMLKDEGFSDMVSSLRKTKKRLESYPSGSVIVLDKENEPGSRLPESMGIKIYKPDEFQALMKNYPRKAEAKVGSKGSWSGGKVTREVTVVGIKEEVEMEAYGNPFTPSVPGTFAAPNFRGGLKAGDKVKVPHKGKMVSGKIVRFDSGGTSKAQQHGGGYVVDVGEPASILVPAHKVVVEEVEVTESIDVQTAKRRFGNFQYKKSSKTVSGDSTEFVLHGVKENELRSIFGAPKSSGGMKQWSFEHDRPLDHQFTIEFDGSDAYINSSRKGNPTVRDHIKGVFGLMGLRVTTESVEEDGEELTEAQQVIGKYRFTSFTEGSVKGWLISVQGMGEVGFVSEPAKRNTKMSVAPHQVFFHQSFQGAGSPSLMANFYPGTETRVPNEKEVRFAPRQLLKAVAMWMDKYGYEKIDHAKK